MAPSGAEEAAALREKALQLYRGEFCEGSTNGCLVEAARALEERYKRAALQQGDYWRAIAHAREKAYGTQGSLAARSSSATSVPPGSSACAEVRMMWREALRNYERVLQVDNYHEEACVHAMQCSAHLGNARGVGLTFNRYRDALATDLSQAPGATVVRAYQECKDVAGKGKVWG